MASQGKFSYCSSLRSLSVAASVAMLTACVTPQKWGGGDNCRWDPESCMYDGQYEPDEEKYAEERAKELNRQSAKKVRRAGWWW